MLLHGVCPVNFSSLGNTLLHSNRRLETNPIEDTENVLGDAPKVAYVGLKMTSISCNPFGSRWETPMSLNAHPTGKD